MAKTTTNSNEKEEPEPWLNSKAKKLLKNDILLGKVTAGMDFLQVKRMRPEFAPYKDEHFKTNLKNLLAAIERNKKRMREDILAYGHDVSVMRDLREKEPLERRPWHRTACPGLLKADIDAGKYRPKHPKDLYATRDEYQAFTLMEFRQHIHQELADREKKKSRPEKKKLRAAERKEYRRIFHGE